MSPRKKSKTMEWYDTTLRDGYQSSKVNFTPSDKLKFLQKLDEFGMDYVELGWPNASLSEMECFKKAAKLKLKNAKIVAFGSTKRKGVPAHKDQTLNAILKTKAKVACLFGKSIKSHVIKQLKLTPKENIKLIADSVAYLKKHRLQVFFDFEHYFDGFEDDRDYALACVLAAADAGADRLVLCDTNGGMLPNQALQIVKQTRQWLDMQGVLTPLGNHFHNDAGCAEANAALTAPYVAQIQGTINGVGERTGNADLCTIIPTLLLKQGYTHKKTKLHKLKELSSVLNTLANLKPNDQLPYVGDDAFKHKAGVHVDAIIKGASYEHIIPGLVGNKRNIVLSNLSGNANIIEMLKEFSIKAKKDDQRVKKLRREVERLESEGYDIDAHYAEKFLLKEKFFGKKMVPFTVENWYILSKYSKHETSEAMIQGTVKEKPRKITATLEHSGPVGAVYRALTKFLASSFPSIERVKLINYKVRIAQDSGAKSTVRVYIEFEEQGKRWGTVGVSHNILEASLEAIAKGFKFYLLK